jgi:fibro-slime domain-containing protein
MRLSPLGYALLIAGHTCACADRADTPDHGTVTTPPATAGSGGAGGGSAAPVSGAGGGIDLNIGGTASGGSGAAGGDGDPGKVITSLPPGFTGSELGGYQLGDSLDAAGAGGSGGAGGGAGANGNCGNILLGVVRDFKGADEVSGHPDFEADIAGADVTPALVAQTLGMDRKPVYASKCEMGATPDLTACPYAAQTTSSARFGEWYSNVPDVAAPYLISIFLQPQPDGLFSFESLHYFPVDGAGFMSMGLEYTGELHNFGFTTEIHTQFRYRGGEKFTFQGDDDVWVFINDKLAVDLGGLHAMKRRTVDLDQQAGMLGLTIGTIYPLDLFHAERHTDASTFRIDTNLSFVDCGTVVPEPVK